MCRALRRRRSGRSQTLSENNFLLLDPTPWSVKRALSDNDVCLSVCPFVAVARAHVRLVGRLPDQSTWNFEAFLESRSTNALLWRHHKFQILKKRRRRTDLHRSVSYANATIYCQYTWTYHVLASIVRATKQNIFSVVCVMAALTNRVFLL